MFKPTASTMVWRVVFRISKSTKNVASRETPEHTLSMASTAEAARTPQSAASFIKSARPGLRLSPMTAVWCSHRGPVLNVRS